MSTHSLTILNDEDGVEIVVMYVHHDGYPSGYGQWLADFLKDGSIDCHEMDEVAAKVVANFADKSTRLFPAGSRDAGEAFTYHVFRQSLAATGVNQPPKYRMMLKVIATHPEGATIFEGPPADYDGKKVEAEYHASRN